MTAPLNAPTKDAASARKRRRRAPAGGAADDCFTCSKRGVKCDRRRPYCSQCLEIGNDCSGYKTQLTWGVGVASRGKLRGLSLPIAKSPPVNCVKKSPTRTRTTSNATPAPWSDQDDRAIREDVEPSADHPQQVHPSSFNSNYDLSQITSPGATPVLTHPPWEAIHYSGGLSANDAHRYQGRPVHLSVPGTGDMLPPSIESISEVDYISPLAHSFPRDDIPFLHSPGLMYDGFQGHGSPVPQSPASAIMIESRGAPTSCPGLVYTPSEPSSSLPSHVDSYDTQLNHKMMQDCDSLVPGTPDLDIYSSSNQSHSPFWAPTIPEEEPAAQQNIQKHNLAPWPSVFHSQLLSVSPDLISRMPFFMDYYENTMCPSMVLIDWSDNPFRNHILQLSTGSRSLQHAICALAACNLRMKRRLSLNQHGREIGDKRLDAAISDSMSEPPEDQSLSEEYQHRNLAVHLLNEQLNDSEKSRHDSVLGTILLLCHYRMAESGIAKFNTQFAGVKKILSLRRSSPFPPSRESAWMEAIFTYFDAITASINDREAQLTPSFHGVMPDAPLLPAGAENLVGCDQELFKTIFKLGRLNLLSQHRPVQNLMNSTLSRGAPSRSESPLDAPMGHTYIPNHVQHQSHLKTDTHGFSHINSRFDGNGFGTTLDEEDMFATAPMHSPTTFDDHRHTFWREWKEARNSLQTWEFDTQRVVAGLSPGANTSSTGVPNSATGPAPTPSQIRDLGSLSEAFRYAALLYTERLANPSVPSSRSDFRNLVSQVVYYATSLESGSSAEKFLLWPLFVAGSECINELQQNIVRSKCRDIMARSGYMNNLAALEILERIWAGETKDEDPSSKMAGMTRRAPFNWAKHMGGLGGEVEWIMF